MSKQSYRCTFIKYADVYVGKLDKPTGQIYHLKFHRTQHRRTSIIDLASIQ
ncbi:MAG: hypothetical protein L0312_20040 [Acidobacteria bacterium]|nr:hypothetical protein [Acidobacteriota bacterium]